MKTHLLLILFGLLINVAGAQQTDTQQLNIEFDKVMTEQFKASEPGATALVAKNGKVIYKKAFGMANLELKEPMRVNGVFRIGSVTKPFTAVAILQLMEQGRLQLQDEITRFISGFPTHGQKITIEHLLTHTSGIQNFTSMKDYWERMTMDLKPEEVIDHFKNKPLVFVPGTKWEYSNSNYFLLGYIIEKITGKTYEEYLEANFFKPLKMTNTFYGGEKKSNENIVGTYSERDSAFVNANPLSMTQPYAAGGIMSSVEDLFKWHQALHAYKLVKKETLDKAVTRYTLANEKKVRYGYGWQFSHIHDSPTIEHGGAINGARAIIMYLPNEDVFVTVLSACDCHEVEAVAAKLAAIAIGQPYERKPMPFYR